MDTSLTDDELLAALSDPNFHAFAGGTTAPPTNDAPAPADTDTGDNGSDSDLPVPPDYVPPPAQQTQQPPTAMPSPAGTNTPPPTTTAPPAAAPAPAPAPDTGKSYTNAKQETGQPSLGTQVASIESGGRPDVVNPQGYAGKYQLGTAALAAAGVYKPAPGEDLSKNEWKGMIVLPGFQPMSVDQFLHNEKAQDLAWNAQTSHLDQEISLRGLDKYYGQTIGGVPITRDTLISLMQIGGPTGAERFIKTGGLYDPKDANGTSMSQYALKVGGKGGSTASAPPSTAATSPFPTFPSAQSIYGPLQQSVADYIKSQPAMWEKLAQMQQQYLQSAKPTPMDTINDAMAAWAQSQIATAGQRHASAGSIVFNQVPDMRGPLQAAENAQRAEQLARQRRLELAKDAYTIGSQNVLGQMEQAGKNIGLQSGLTQGMAEYGLNSGKIGIELAKFGQDQAKAISDYIDKAVPNAETAAKVRAAFSQQGNPAAPLSQNMATVDKIIAGLQQGGAQVAQNVPAKMYEVSFTDPDGTVHRETVNGATVAGQQRLAELSKKLGVKMVDLGAPQNNQTVNAGNGQGQGEGRGQHSSSDYYSAAQQTTVAADAALKLLPYMKANGGTGLITDSPAAQQVWQTIKQLVPDFDPTKQTIRQLYGKLVSQIQVASILPNMARLGRGTGGEFQKFLTTQIGPANDVDTVGAYLRHMRDQAAWDQAYYEAYATAEGRAKTQNNMFLPDVFKIQYMKAHPMPSWDVSEVGAANAPPPQTPTPPPAPAGPPKSLPQKVEEAPTAAKQQLREGAGGAINWMRRQLGLEPSAPAPQAPAASAPANQPASGNPPATPNVLPLTPADKKLFRGQ